MSHSVRLKELLQHPRLWLAGEQTVALSRCFSSGFPALDRALGGGWPPGELIELITHTQGAGEFGLLMPAIAGMIPRKNPPCRTDPQGHPDQAMAVQATRWVMLIAPPYIPYAPALDAYGLDLSRLLVVHPARQMDTLWAIEQALRSGTCAAVIGWTEASDERALRRLQLAAEVGSGWAVLFRSSHFQEYGSPAALRIYLQREGNVLTLRILKQRGGLPGVVRVHI